MTNSVAQNFLRFKGASYVKGKIVNVKELKMKIWEHTLRMPVNWKQERFYVIPSSIED